MTTTKINLTKANLEKHANEIKAKVEKDIRNASSDTTTFANSLQRALNGSIYHALITGKNNLPNNLIVSLSKKRVTAGKSQSVLSNYMLNKLKAYILHFVPFLEINKGDAKEKFPLANKSGTKEGLQLSQDEINQLVKNLPLFTSWKKPKPKAEPKPEKSLLENFQAFYSRNLEKLIGQSIENDDDLKLFNALMAIVNSLPVIEKDDLSLAKAEADTKAEAEAKTKAKAKAKAKAEAA